MAAVLGKNKAKKVAAKCAVTAAAAVDRRQMVVSQEAVIVASLQMEGQPEAAAAAPRQTMGPLETPAATALQQMVGSVEAAAAVAPGQTAGQLEDATASREQMVEPLNAAIRAVSSRRSGGGCTSQDWRLKKDILQGILKQCTKRMSGIDAVTYSKAMKYIIDELIRASSPTCRQSYENVIETAFCDFPSLCCFPDLFRLFDLPVYTIKPKSKTEKSAMAKAFVFEFKTKYYSS